MDIDFMYDELQRFTDLPLKIKREMDDTFTFFIDDVYITTFIPSEQNLDMMKTRINEIKKAYLKGFEEFRIKAIKELEKYQRRKFGYTPDFF